MQHLYELIVTHKSLAPQGSMVLMAGKGGHVYNRPRLVSHDQVLEVHYLILLKAIGCHLSLLAEHTE